MSDGTDLSHPRNISALLGHADTETAILQLLRTGRMPHALLLAGPRGIGKATLAYRIARFILASGSPDPVEPSLFGGADTLPPDSLYIDENHPVFARVASGGHPNLLTIERAINPDTGRVRRDIVVDDVRKAAGFVQMTAADGSWRVAIVDSADEMNVSAANALLKILEEPPEKVLFLLVSHAPGRLLATIRSRCRRLSLSALSPATVEELLTRMRPSLDGPDRTVVAALADGSIGDALQLADAGGLDLFSEVTSFLKTPGRLDMARLHALAERVGRNGREAEFETLAHLLDRILTLLIRHAARGDPAPSQGLVGLDFGSSLLARASLDRWLAVWDNVTRLMRQANSASLDRRQVVISAFLALDSVAVGSRR